MKWNSVTGWTAGLLMCFSGIVAQAEQPSAAELYGRGVGAYFSGDVATAVTLLDKAIKADPNDPRAFYFRGLAKFQQGEADAARADFAKGAELETEPTTRVYDVDDALQRIQGTVRIEIENQRRAALRAAAEKKRKQDKVRYERLQRREKEVLFDPNRPAPKIDFEVKPTAVQVDPFATGLAFTGGKQVAVKTAPKGPAAAPGTTTPKPRDPFAAPTPKDPFAPATPKSTKPDAAGENPFGTMTPATPSADTAAKPTTPNNAPPAEDPFGIGGTPPAGAAPANPTAAPTSAAPGESNSVVGTTFGLLGKMLSGQSKARDPFGESPSTTDDEKAAGGAAPKADAPDDPFGTSTPPKTDTPTPPTTPSKPESSAPADDPFK